jgi:hypothetical protein
MNNENVLWNMVTMYSQAKGKNNPEEGKKMVERVRLRNKRVKSALVERGCRSVERILNKFQVARFKIQ